MKRLPLILAALLAAAPAAATAPIAPIAPIALGPLAGLTLTDQHGATDRPAAHRGEPLVVVVADARRLAQVRRWEQQIATRVPGLRILTIADVNEKKPPELQRVQAVLARRVPPGVPVLIDLERAWARTLSLDTAAPNILLVDREGAVVQRFRGRWNEAEGERVVAAALALKGGR